MALLQHPWYLPTNELTIAWHVVDGIHTYLSQFPNVVLANWTHTVLPQPLLSTFLVEPMTAWQQHADFALLKVFQAYQAILSVSRKLFEVLNRRLVSTTVSYVLLLKPLRWIYHGLMLVIALAERSWCASYQMPIRRSRGYGKRQRGGGGGGTESSGAKNHTTLRSRRIWWHRPIRSRRTVFNALMV